MLRILAVYLPACISIGAGVAVPAQEVTGLVHIAGSTAVARGASVVLLDSAGTVLRGTLTGDDGRFTLQAPSAGRYRVRVRQIGFSPDSSRQLELSRDKVAAVEFSLNRFVVVLDSVEVVRKSRCAIAPAAGSVALQLWEDVQSALTAAVITDFGPHAQTALLTRFRRQLDPATGRVLRTVTWQAIGSASAPYRAIPADTLAARGFVVRDGKDLEYFAPDARTILADAFARTHCFRPAADARHPGLIGLAFAPTRASGPGQIAGVLWLDAASRELRYIEFKFSSQLSGDVARVSDASDATGRVEYERLPWGGWIVARWILHIPVVAVQTTGTVTGASLALGTMFTPRRTAEVVALWEIGGDARVITDGSVVLAKPGEGGAIHGHVLYQADSGGSRAPAGGMRIELLPATGVTQDDPASVVAVIRSRVTDPAGEFSFDGLPAGDYTLRIKSARLDTLAITVPDRPIHLDSAQRLSTTTVLPTVAAIVRTICGSGTSPSGVALHGTVLDARTGQPVPGAVVKSQWDDAANAGGASASAAHKQNVTAVTGPDGSYALCTAEPLHPMLVNASVGGRSTAAVRVDPSRSRIRMLDFVM